MGEPENSKPETSTTTTTPKKKKTQFNSGIDFYSIVLLLFLKENEFKMKVLNFILGDDRFALIKWKANKTKYSVLSMNQVQKAENGQYEMGTEYRVMYNGSKYKGFLEFIGKIILKLKSFELEIYSLNEISASDLKVHKKNAKRKSQN
jgi:hypothetical protein